MAIHDIDVIRYITGAEVESVFAAGGIQASGASQRLEAPGFTPGLFADRSDWQKGPAGKHEDFADIMMMLRSGATGLVEVNWLTPMKIRKLTLTCSQRYVGVDYMNQTIDISSSTVMDLDTTNLFEIPQEYDHRHPKSRWMAGWERDCGTNALHQECGVLTLKKQEPLKNELLDFLEAVEKKRKPLVTGELHTP